MEKPAASEQLTSYRQDLMRVLSSVQSGSAAVHVPPSQNLFRSSLGRHFHSTPEILIQTGGRSHFDCPGFTFVMEPGDACLMPRGVPHAETPEHTKTSYGLLVCMHFRDGQYLHRARADRDLQIEGVGTMRLTGSNARDAFRYLDDAVSATTIPAALKQRHTRALLEVFLMVTISEVEQLGREPESPEPAPSLVVGAERLIRSRLGDSTLRISGIGSHFGVSPDHLSRQFHRARGQRLATWITEERLSLAGDLLMDPRYQIAEVGWACGFKEPSYFIRVFRNHRGMTPKQWRDARMNAP